MNKLRKLLAITIVCALPVVAAGCAIFSMTSYGPVDEQTVKLLKEGSTNETDLVKYFGGPNVVIERPGRKMWVYRGWWGITVLGVHLGNRQDLVLSLTEDGILEQKEFSRTGSFITVLGAYPSPIGPVEIR